MSKLVPAEYIALLSEIKERVRSAQYAALRSVNRELIALYWDIGRMIVGRQVESSWGKSGLGLGSGLGSGNCNKVFSLSFIWRGA